MRKFLFVIGSSLMVACSSAKTEDVSTDSTSVNVATDTTKLTTDTVVADSTRK